MYKHSKRERFQTWVVISDKQITAEIMQTYDI